jgi:subtilisin family serine protease
MTRSKRSGSRARRAWLWLSISLLFTVGLLLSGSTVGADDSIPAPTPGSGQHARVERLSVQISASPAFDSQGPYIYLANYTFDPLSEATLHSLPPDLTLSDYPSSEEGYYLVQFHGPIQPAWTAAVVAAGARIFDYIPDFVFIVKMGDATKAAVEAMDTVRWVGVYQPGYRIVSSLMDTRASAGGAEVVDVVVIVFEGEDMAAITEQLREKGGTILDATKTHWKGKVRVQIPRSQINAVAHLSGVKWIEPSPEWELLNNKSADILGVREVWDTHGLYGAGETVAVCDTGLDQGSASPGSLHDDFEDGSGGSRVVTIYDRVGDGAGDVNGGHGTHVAGSVLGNGDRSGSTPNTRTYPSNAYVGMAPEASLVFQAVEENSTGDLDGIPSDLNTLFGQVLGDGARIHTNSWGHGTAGGYDSSSEEVDEFVWDHPDFTILFAAGNAGIDNDADGVVDLLALDSPGTAKNCITVGATENDRSSKSVEWGDGWPDEFPANPIHGDRVADDPDGMAAFSSRGPALDGRFKPDVLATGTFVASVRSSVASGSGWGTINSYYMYMGGTSMATPLVAGTAALVREYYTDIEGITPSAALIKATLVNGATDISPGQYGTGSDQEIPDPPRPNNVEGWGRVNVENSIFPASPRELVYYDETSGLGTGGESAYDLEVTNSSEPLKITLAWSDYPGSAAAAGGLVNDLDLSVTAPGGTVYYPNNANRRSATQYLDYDSGPYWLTQLSSGRGAAVRFTPTSYPAQLDKAVFFVYASSYPTTFTCNVWDDNGAGGAPGTNLFSQSVTAREQGWLVVDISGVIITSGDFYIEMRLSGSNPRIVSDILRTTGGRSWYYDGSSWESWSYNGDVVIHAVVVGSEHSTSFDRVNNVVGVDVDSPTLGTYTIRVRGHNVPHGPQPYALVASGAIHGVTNSAPVIAGLPDQPLPVDTSLDNAIDLWAYASDTESPDSDLTFTIDNSPDPSAGVSIDSNRYIDINPVSGWTGQTNVTIRVADPGGLSDTDTFQVTVTGVPDIDVSPTSFEEMMHEGEAVTKTLTINNDGSAALGFGIAEQEGGVTSLSDGNILLMGDDVGAAGWVTYRDALTAAGRTWTEWDLDVLSFPTAEDLSPYEVLIWFDESVLVPGNAQCQIVADWLVSGGKSLFVTGIDFLWDLENGTAGYGEHNLYLLLNTEYLGDYAGGGVSTLEGVPGDPIGGDFVPPASLGLAGNSDSSGDYASETVGAPTGLLYGSGGTGSTHSGLTHHEGSNYRTVWLGVNFHNGLPSQAERNQLMENTLNFLAGGADVPWLSEEPTSGTVPAGGSLPVDVIFDATGMAVGDHTAELVISSNDPDESSTTVSVVMHVRAGVYLPLVVRDH